MRLAAWTNLFDSTLCDTLYDTRSRNGIGNFLCQPRFSHLIALHDAYHDPDTLRLRLQQSPIPNDGFPIAHSDLLYELNEKDEKR